MRVCLFTGTFNPIHIGHLMVINFTIEKFFIDLLYIIPNRIPVHKKRDIILPSNLRLKFIQMSIKELKYKDKIVVSDFEIKSKFNSYTFYTVSYYRELHRDDDIFLLIGDDSLIFYKWFNFKEIFKLVDKFIIISRYLKYENSRSFIEKVIKIYESNKEVLNSNKECQNLNWDLYEIVKKNQAELENKFEILDLPKIEISSKYIIDRLRSGLSVDYMLNNKVKKIIQDKFNFAY